MDAAALRVVVLDVDGTMALTERWGHRVAFNEAFEGLGLPYRWDEELYGDLLAVGGGEARLRHYLEDRVGIAGPEAADLARELHVEKTRIFQEMIDAGRIPARAGLVRFVDALLEDGLIVAVATTGSRVWVEVLLQRLLDAERASALATVVTGDDVRRRKPDPEAYELVCQRLGADPGDAVAVEDSQNGVAAAKGAGLACLAVLGEYGTPEDVESAHLVVDGFGEPGAPLRVLRDPLGVESDGMLDAEAVRSLHRRVRGRSGA